MRAYEYLSVLTISYEPGMPSSQKSATAKAIIFLLCRLIGYCLHNAVKAKF